MKKISKVIVYVLVFTCLIAPIVSMAAGLVPCGGKGEEMCTFPLLMTLINKVINFILFVMAVPIAAIMFAYAGIMLLTSGGEAAKKTKAKELFMGVAIGLVVAAAAWIIIHTLLLILGHDGSWIGF